MNIYIFECQLVNKEDIEENFTAEARATAMCLAKDKLDEFLQKEWGFIVKRAYKKETMINDRFWDVDLSKVILDGKEKI